MDGSGVNDRGLCSVTTVGALIRVNARGRLQQSPHFVERPAMAERKVVIPIDEIEGQILLIRGQKVMLDSALAQLYEVELRTLNQAVKRNLSRFPSDFMLQLSAEEAEELRSVRAGQASLRSQIVILKSARGQHRKYLPFAFTEQGVAMLSSVLRSPRAIMVNIEVIRAFVRLRQMLSSNAALARKLAALESKYDAQFKAVFDAIRELMNPAQPRKERSIGFSAWEEK